MRDVAGFAGNGRHVGVYVREPVGMPLAGIVAGVTAAHGAFELGCNVELRALSAGKIMVGSLEIFADIQSAGVVFEMLWIISPGFECVGRIVQCVMTVGAI